MLKELEKALKSRYNHGIGFPEIRYFDGTDTFSTADGRFEGKTLEDSLNIYLGELLEFKEVMKHE